MGHYNHYYKDQLNQVLPEEHSVESAGTISIKIISDYGKTFWLNLKPDSIEELEAFLERVKGTVGETTDAQARLSTHLGAK